jgi:hypothetical protein
MVSNGSDCQTQRPGYPCNCCGFRTLADPSRGSYEICPVCFWEDDPVQNDDPSFTGGANATCLADARENYFRCGASDPRLSGLVRSARIDEVPWPPLIAGLDTANRAESIRGVKRLLLGIVRAVLSGHISTFAGCSAIAGVAFPLDEPELNLILRTFEVVAGETDEFPTGETRKLWHPELLKAKDAEATDYENRIRSEVQNACRQLKECLEAEAK